MKKNLLFCVAFFATVNMSAANPGDTITLDLAHPTNPTSFVFNEKDVWTETYDTLQYAYIESQVFAFSHLPSGENYGSTSWEGFTVCKVASDTSNYFGCMAKGGIAGVGTPYMLGYYSDYYSMMHGQSSNQLIFNDGNKYEMLGMYVCSNSVSYNDIINGSTFARKFAAGDSLTLTVEALDESYQTTGKKLIFYLADYRSEDLADWTVNKSWEWFDMSALGEVDGVAFSVTSSDQSYGFCNTATYFTIDQLKVRVPKMTALNSMEKEQLAIYTHHDYIEVTGTTEPVEIYSIQGVKILSSREQTISTIALPSGVYIVKYGTQSLKIIK
ncbi:MAG: DUF4465 domain-containing protein [Sphingobacteriia bacterium]|nr:DUF4465 domain-containing protein [Sphingobacteriia bacterium]